MNYQTPQSSLKRDVLCVPRYWRSSNSLAPAGGADTPNQKQETLTPYYQQEWLASGASQETIDLCLCWSKDWEPDEDMQLPGMDMFLYNSPGLRVYNNNRYSTAVLRQWGYLEDGYWAVDGLDPLNGWQQMEWFQAKPVNPKKWYEIKDKPEGKRWFDQPVEARPEYVDKYSWNKVAKHFGLSTMEDPHSLHPAGFWDWVKQNGLTNEFYLKEHIQKYVCPPKVPTRATFLRISQNQSAQHFGEELPPDADGAAEATDHWQRCLEENRPIVLCEDAGKKSACIINHVTGVMPIGLPGICGGVRSEKDEHGQLVPGGEKWLIPELKVFATKNRTVYICFDQDKKKSTRHANSREVKKLGKLLTQAGCKVFIVTWPKSWGKGIDDVWANGHDIQKLFDRAQSFNQFVNGYLWKLTREPDLLVKKSDLVEVNGKPYLNLERPDPKQHPLVFLKAPKSQGKTELVRKWADAEKQKVMMLVHRRTLGRSLADRLNTDFVDDNYSESDESNGIALCWDSLRIDSRANLKPKDFAGKIIFIDEVEQSIKHLLQSSTCQKERPEILRFWIEALRVCISTGGQVICADADLSDVSLFFFQEIFKNLEMPFKPYLIVSEYIPPSYEAFLFDGRSPAKLLVEIERQLKRGRKVLLVVDSQQPSSKCGTHNLLKRFQNKFPDKRMGRTDSETVSAVKELEDERVLPLYPQFMIGSCINEHLEMFRYDLMIVSPTIGSGVSIDIPGLFDFVAGISFGVVPSSEFRQALMRYRELVPRLIWTNMLGIGIQGGSKLPKEIRQNRNIMLNWANRQLELGLMDDEIEPHGIHVIFEQTEAKLQARIVADCRYYQQSVVDGLLDEGCRILDADDDISKDEADRLKAEMTAVKEESEDIEAQAIATVDMEKVDPRLDKKQALTTKERHQLRNSILQQKYAVPARSITPELVKLDNDGHHSKIWFNRYAFTHPEEIAVREYQKMLHAYDWNVLEYCRWDIKLSLPMIHVLQKINIQQWIDLSESGEPISKDTPGLADWATEVQKWAPQLKMVGLPWIGGMSNPVRILGAILKHIGYSLFLLKRRGSDGQRVREYRIKDELKYETWDKSTGEIISVDENLRQTFLEVMAGWEKRDWENAVKPFEPTSDYRIAKFNNIFRELICVANDGKQPFIWTKQQVIALVDKLRAAPLQIQEALTKVLSNCSSVENLEGIILKYARKAYHRLLAVPQMA